MGILNKLLGTKNERELKKLQPQVERINALEGSMKEKSDAQLQAMTGVIRGRIAQRNKRFDAVAHCRGHHIPSHDLLG